MSDIQLPDVSMGALGRAILTQANVSVPDLEVCQKKLLNLLDNDPYYGQPKPKKYREAQQAKLKDNLVDSLSRYNQLSIKSIGLIAKHAEAMANILFYAKCLFEFEQSQNPQIKLIDKYKNLYLYAKNLMRNSLGDEAFANLMRECMEASSTKGHELFGILFHADCYCEPELQHIADIANTASLSKIKGDKKKSVKINPNLFGSEREYKSVPLKAGIGNIMLPVNPIQENTVYVVCPNLEALGQDPARILAQLQQGAGQAIFAEIQQAIRSLHPPKGWKANIKVFGENKGAQIAAEYFRAIQSGLSHQLALQEAGRKITSEGELPLLADQVQSVNVEQVYTLPSPPLSALLQTGVREALPSYDRFLGNSRVAPIVQGAGVANFVLDNLDNPLVQSVDNKLQQYHYYRVAKPILVLSAKCMITLVNYTLTGAALGSAIPGVGTGLGAAIGLGVAVVGMIFKGYMLWKEKKQEALRVAALEQGLEVQSSFERLGTLPAPQPTLRFSSEQQSPPQNKQPELKQAAVKLKKKQPKSVRRRDGKKRPGPDYK